MANRNQSSNQQHRKKSLNRPQHSTNNKPQDRSSNRSGQRNNSRRSQRGGSYNPRQQRGKRSRGGDDLRRRDTRDDRLLAALCHSGVFFGIWGLFVTGLIWVFRKQDSRVVRFQGAQAIFYQLFAQLCLFVGFGVYLFTTASPEGIALETLQHYVSIPPVYLRIALWGENPIVLNIVVLIWFTLVIPAAVFFVLSLLALEPSYPGIGYLTRAVLGLRTPQREKQKSEDEKKKSEDEKKKPEKMDTKNEIEKKREPKVSSTAKEGSGSRS